jgi:hypothetical protein
MTITYSGGITFNGGFYSVSNPPTYYSPYGIFGYGNAGAGGLSMTNKVSDTGVVATDTTGVGTARGQVSACNYGVGLGMFGFGYGGGSTFYSITNKVSITGVVASDTTNSGVQARQGPAGCSYGEDKGIFAYGYNSTTTPNYTSIVNLVSNTGVLASDTNSPGVGRYRAAASGYGGDKGIIAYGQTSTYTETTTFNLISNTGVIANDSTGAGTARTGLAACGYGDRGECLFGYGLNNELSDTFFNMYNLVSSTGVIATDTAGVGTVRGFLAATSYGLDKGLFGYGDGPITRYSLTNKVSNTGVVATDTAGVGTARGLLAACGYG